MAFTLAELKERSNTIARRAKMGQMVEKEAIALLNDLIIALAKKEALQAPTAVVTLPAQPGVVATAVAAPAPAAAPANIPVPQAEAPARRRRAKVSGTSAPNPTVTVGNAAAPTEAPAPSEGVGAPPVQSVDTNPGSKVIGKTPIPRNKNIRIGNQGVVNTGVTVGSAPHAPIGQVTVGGRVVNNR